MTASVAPPSQLSPKLDRLREAGVKVAARPAFQAGVARRIARKLAPRHPWAFLVKEKPDLVVISQCGFVDGIEAMDFCREQGLPYVAIVQLNAEVFWPTDAVRERLRRVYPAARRVCCVSAHNLELLRRQLGESLSQGEVVRNPFNVSPDLALEWPSTAEGLRIACVARLDPGAKGQDILFAIFRREDWRARAVELNLYGTGLCADGVRDLAGQLCPGPQVRLHGHVAKVEEIWERNHLLVLPSRYEGTPLALVEAMWRGRAAVVTDVGGNAELCQEGVTGFVAPAATEDLVARALERAWQRREEWEALGRAARARVEQLVPRDPVGVFAQSLLD